MPQPTRRLLHSLYRVCCSENVFGEISDSYLRFAVRRKCNSSVALAAVDLDKRPKRKKISKNERHAMVETFIAEYRQSNAGKFPSADNVQKKLGGSYYTIRDIVQQIKYSHKFALPNNIAAVQLGKVDDVSEQTCVKDETSSSNLHESTVNGRNSEAVPLGKEGSVDEHIFASEETLISNGDDDNIGKANSQSFGGKEELLTGYLAENETALFDELISDAKPEYPTCTIAEDKEEEGNVVFYPNGGLSTRTGREDKENAIRSSNSQAEPSTCVIVDDKAVEVHYDTDTKEGLLSCGKDKDKKYAAESFDSKGESTADNGDAVLKYSSKNEDECLVFDTSDSHSSDPVAKKDIAEEEFQSMNDTKKDDNARTNLEEHKNEYLKEPDVVRKTDEDSSMGLLNNLRSFKDKIFSFWKNL